MLLVYLLWWFIWNTGNHFTTRFFTNQRQILWNFLYFLLLLANNALKYNFRQLGEATTANQETTPGSPWPAGVGFQCSSLSGWPLEKKLSVELWFPLDLYKQRKIATGFIALCLLPLFTHTAILVPGSSMEACPSSLTCCLPATNV